MQAIEWCHFRFPSVTRNPDCKRRMGLSATAGLSCFLSEHVNIHVKNRIFFSTAYSMYYVSVHFLHR